MSLFSHQNVDKLCFRKNVITHDFLEKCHTHQIEVDSVHFIIRRELRHREMLLPCQHYSVTKEVRKNLPPYDLPRVIHTFSKDYSVKSNPIYDTVGPGRGTGFKCVTDI